MEQFIQDTKTLARKLTHKHGGCITTPASLYYLSHEYLNRLGQRHNTDMRPFIAVITQAMGNWSIANGYTRAQCQAALDDVEQTMLTTAHLAVCSRDIPDNISLNHLILIASKKATRASLRGR